MPRRATVVVPVAGVPPAPDLVAVAATAGAPALLVGGDPTGGTTGEAVELRRAA